jgi:hypothetical protein
LGFPLEHPRAHSKGMTLYRLSRLSRYIYSPTFRFYPETIQVYEARTQ